MNRLGLGSGVCVAGGFALAALGAWNVLPALFGAHFGFRLLVALLAWLYLLVLLGRTREKVGRVATGVVGGVALAALVCSHCTWAGVLFGAVAVIWVARSMFSYSSLLGAVADALVCFVAVGWALAAYSYSYSVAWAVWCFFLAQALVVFIPEKPELTSSPVEEAAGDRFACAHRTAEAAIRALANR
jgi:hypothetical protein